MKTLFSLVTISLFSTLGACVTYNPATQTYVVDTYGSWEVASEKCDRKKIKPKDEVDSPWDMRIDKPKIIKQPRPIDWDESY